MKICYRFPVLEPCWPFTLVPDHDSQALYWLTVILDDDREVWLNRDRKPAAGTSARGNRRQEEDQRDPELRL
jgi:hypothetical protein